MNAHVKTFSPECLYRYRSISTPEKFEQEVKCLQEGRLWCSNFEMLNDPMEGSYYRMSSKPEPIWMRYIHDAIYSEKSRVGICSFSEMHDSGPMWAHYADQFRGMCIEYNFDSMIQSLNDLHTFVRVSYEEAPCKIGHYNLHDRELRERILSSKSHRWLYEREWRLFSPSPGSVRLKKDCIGHVYAGNRMPKECKRDLKRILRKLDIPFSEMKVDGYTIDFRAAKTEHSGMG